MCDGEQEQDGEGVTAGMTNHDASFTIDCMEYVSIVGSDIIYTFGYQTKLS